MINSPPLMGKLKMLIWNPLKYSNQCAKIQRFYSSSKSIKLDKTSLDKCLEVPTFCSIDINLSCSIILKHLDVHNYPNCDKLFIKLHNPDNNNFSAVCTKDERNVKIFDENTNEQELSTVCEIIAPIKADLNVTSKNGNLNVGFFNNNNLILNALNGNITISKYEGGHLVAQTHNGDISLSDTVKALDLKLKIQDNGSIVTNRLQALKLEAETRNGNISVESSYCNESHFKIGEGNLNLENVHRNCDVVINKHGSLKMTGFDGRLKAFLKSGDADIQLSQISEDSEMEIGQGNLTLLLSEFCSENTSFEITSQESIVAGSIGLVRSKSGDITYLSAVVDNSKNFIVKCPNGIVNVKSASWADVLELKYVK